MARRTAEQLARRKQIYSHYRSLGFSAGEARMLRDESMSTRVDVLIVKRQTLESGQQSNASQRMIQNINTESSLLNQEIRERKQRPNRSKSGTIKRRVSLPSELDFVPDELRGSASSNRQNFSLWSSIHNGFPPDIHAFVTKMNTSHNHMANSSFGYRVFYRMYVLGWDEARAMSKVREMIDEGVGSNNKS